MWCGMKVSLKAHAPVCHVTDPPGHVWHGGKMMEKIENEITKLVFLDGLFGSRLDHEIF